MAEAAVQGTGVALLPVRMFERDLGLERLVRPFDVEVVLGAYWLTSLKSRTPTSAMEAFRSWLMATSRTEVEDIEAPRGGRPAQPDGTNRAAAGIVSRKRLG